MAEREGGGEGSATERLLARLSRPIGDADRHRAALHLLDWLGCAALGRASPEGRVLSATLGENAVLPLFAPGTPDARAFALGGLGSVTEMDDVHRTALLHPGPVVMPAVLAFGPDTPGKRLLDALIAGYEAMIAIGASLGHGHYRFFHPTATCGGFGAAAAAARLIGLEDHQVVWALGNAGSTAGGLFQCLHEPVMTKHYHVAEAARRGVAAALLARQGLSGPRFILEGPQGFFAALAPEGDPSRVAADPDAAWAIWEVSFKPWPACRHVHAAIDAAVAARKALGGRAAERIEVETYADAIRICDRAQPATVHEAKFSLQHAVAVALAKGRPALGDFSPENLNRDGVGALRAKVQVREATRFSSAYPSRFGAAVAVVTADGGRVSEEVPDAWGDPENPMSEDDVVAKSLTLLKAAGFSNDQAGAAADAVLALPLGGSLAALDAALSPASLREVRSR